MKKYITILGLFLCGCTTTVYVPQLPEAPQSLKQRCGELEVIAENATTQDAVKVIAGNYSKYHECSDKVDLWNEWYSKQKELIGHTQIK